MVCWSAMDLASAQARYAGSDTVLPVVEAAKNSYLRGHPGFTLQESTNGSSSGIRDLCAGRVALIGSSRPIKADEQRDCADAKISFVEIPVAFDGVALVVSQKNTWLKALSLKEVQALFAHQSPPKLTNWKQLRAEFPDLALKTTGVGFKHGTFQFFTEAIGNARLIRPDFKDTGHHTETVKMVVADSATIGFVPYATVKDFDSQIRSIAIDFGKGPVQPGRETLADGRYGPLGRQVYLYLNLTALEKAPAERDFAKFLLSDLEKYVGYANLTTLPNLQYQEAIRRVSFAH